jgi:hexosaminidase
MNVFHWHLTEDQGWRIEIQQYPRLTEVGARRAGTQVGGYLSARQDDRPHGGYYSQEDLREVVEYAAERFITIVPEIEMPGHSTAALAAYPELSCRGEPIEVATRFGIHKEIFCAGKEQTFAFLEGVLDEVMAVFPGAVIHIGGDEVRKTRWKSCPDCQARMRAEGLADVGDLQDYFVRRIAAHLASKGRRAMGWNQILHDDLAPEVICQYWALGLGEVLEHARADRDVVMSPALKTYLDYDYSLTPLRQAYAYEPIPARLEAEHHGHVLGLEAPLWTEFVPTLDRMDWQTYPRLTAYAEVGWSPGRKRDYADFRARLAPFLERLDLLGVRYAPLAEVDPGLLKRLAAPFMALVGRRGGPEP